MHAIEFTIAVVCLTLGLFGLSRFGLAPLARRLQRARGYSDQFVTEMTVALPIALFMIFVALLVAVAIP